MRNILILITLLATASCAPRTTPNTIESQTSEIEFSEAITRGQAKIRIDNIGRMWHLRATAGAEDRTIEVPCSFLGCGTIYEVISRKRHINETDIKYTKPDTIYLTQPDTLRLKLEAMHLLTMDNPPPPPPPPPPPTVATPALPDGVKVTHPDGSNPLRDALQPLPQSAIFEMEGYGMWCPSVVKVDDTYHLFCSRWASDKVWQQSEVIRATSQSLFGPYTFQEVVLSAESHPWAEIGVHNPKVMRVGDRFLLYYIGMPTRETGFAFADNVEGPWEIIDHPVMPANNPAIVVHEDSSVYVVGKFHRHNKDCLDGFNDVAMRAYSADSLLGEYRTILDDGNRLPGEFELEDPALQYVDGKYHLLCTDWQGEATGIQKAVVYYTSTDGINYELYSQTSVWDQSDEIPMTDGSTTLVSQIERPELFIGDDGQPEALLVGVISRPGDPAAHDDNYIMIRPIKGFSFQ